MTDSKSEEISQAAAAVPFYHRVIAAVQPFLGAHTEQFVRRQCTHIKISPEKLAPEHVELLAWWMKVSAKLVMPREKADQMYEKLVELAKQK